uniref:Synergin gamma n=1 Tax=Sipha flava TaxID=143950 RepID=A0A2S2QIR4_9HEMI
MDTFEKNFTSSSKTITNDKNLPKWMIPKSGFVHPLYEQIWQYVKSDKRDRTCDTNLVSQLLMTSGLPVDILGRLWSMANIGIEGSLSQQELYVILALITLVQNGYSVSNISLLQHIHKPIIPQLNYTLVEKKHYSTTVKPIVEHKPQVNNKLNKVQKISNEQHVYTKCFQESNIKVFPTEDYDPLAVTFIKPKSQMSKIIPPLTANQEPKSLDLALVDDSFETIDDEFSDFQCAQFTNIDSKNNHDFTDFQSAFGTLSFKESSKSIEQDSELLNVPSTNIVSNTLGNQQHLINYNDNIHDKYEVFRTLAAENDDDDKHILHENYDDMKVKPIKKIENNVQNYEMYDDEFGDFLCVEEVSNNKSEIEVDWKNVQIQCINKCLEFLQQGFSTFSCIQNEKILMEIINHDKGVKYLKQLNLISQVCKRILQNCNCPSLEDNFTNILSKLETYFNYFIDESINISEVLNLTKEIIPCYLCKCDCSTDSIEYMLNYYHSSCINFLVNFVQTSQLSVK